MFKKEIRPQIWALILMSLGGVLLHVRIHPPAESAFNWIPMVFGLANAFVLPFLFNRASTVAWAYVATLLTVAVGTVTMGWFSLTHWTVAVTPVTVVLNSTLADILVLCAKVPIAHSILLHYQAASAAVAVSAPAHGDVPPIATVTPDAEDVAEVRVMPAIARNVLRAACVLGAVVLVAVAAWIGIRSHFQYAGPPAPLQVALKTAGKTAGLVAGMLLMLQFTLSARIKLLDRAFGLDRLLLFHRAMGATAACLVVLHPALLYATEIKELGPLRWELWPVLLGALTLALVGSIVIVSVWRLFLGLSYETWHRLHYAVFVVVALVATHSLIVGRDVHAGWPRTFWCVVIAAYVVLFVWAKAVKPALLRRRRFVVKTVTPVSHNTYNVALEPSGHAGLRQAPGQFAFLKLNREGLAAEEHPFTISSCPNAEGKIAFTIKQSGDYTSTIGQTSAGDTATVDGPFGCLSHLIHGAGDLVMIAGGVGITPMLSMLAYMRATRDERRVTLVWGNRTEADILFRDELEAAAAEMPHLTVHHVLSHQDDFVGETGYVDEAMLRKLLDETDLSARILLCGPPPMMFAVHQALANLGVPARRVLSEKFSL